MNYKLFIASVGAFIAGLGSGVLLQKVFSKKRFEKELAEAKNKTIVDVTNQIIEKHKREEDEKKLNLKYVVDTDPLAIDGAMRYRFVPEDSSIITEFNKSKEEVEAIRPITPYEFASDISRDKKTLVYYDEEDILADEDDNQISPGDVVMNDFYSYFGDDMFDDEDVIYVRNDNMATDYEIVRRYVRLGDHPGFEDDD